MGIGDEFLRKVYHQLTDVLDSKYIGTRTNEDGQLVCFYCGKLISIDTESGIELYAQEHVIPRSRGGVSQAPNYVASCPTCNSSKQARFPLEWVARNRRIDMTAEAAIELLARILAGAYLSYRRIEQGRKTTTRRWGLEGKSFRAEIFRVTDYYLDLPTGHTWDLKIAEWVPVPVHCADCGGNILARYEFGSWRMLIECVLCGAKEQVCVRPPGTTAIMREKGYRCWKDEGDTWELFCPAPNPGPAKPTG